MIPKIIHYCWLSNNPIPSKLQEYMESWKKQLPDYEFILWNFERFDINSSIWVKQAFEAKKYAFAADYIRLFAVYHYGGIYMDMDVEVVKSFNPLLNNSCILGKEDSNAIEAGVFGAEKNAVWIKECLDYYEDRCFIRPDGSFDIKPLPLIMYDILYDSYIKNGTLSIFEPVFLTAKSSAKGKIYATRDTYTIHHFAGSWVSKSRKIAFMLKPIIGEKIIDWIIKQRKSLKWL